MPKILAIDDDPDFLYSVKNLLEYKKFKIKTVTSPENVKQELRATDYDCILMDVVMPKMDGLKLLKEVLIFRPNIPVIMISGQSTISTAVEALKEGAFDFLEKPLDAERLMVTVRNALEKRSWLQEKENLLAQLDEAFPIVGVSPQLQQILKRVKMIARSPVKVLILGESGTGKELIARALHRYGPRHAKPFVRVNCAAIPGELLESELFGYRRGSFTGASQDHRGKFFAADGGTLFLDEIGDLELRLQGKLLTVLQDGEVELIGENRPRRVDVRIIAATNRDLGKMVEERQFREDLYHRLNVVQLYIPPLRERKSDIPVLARYFLAQFAKTYNRKLVDFTTEALFLLQDYDWPGNVRELKNIIEKIVIFTDGETVGPADVYRAFDNRWNASGEDKPDHLLPLKDAVEDFEKKHIKKVLEVSNWKIGEASTFLGINRATLFKKMKKLNIVKKAKGSFSV